MPGKFLRNPSGNPEGFLREPLGIHRGIPIGEFPGEDNAVVTASQLLNGEAVVTAFLTTLKMYVFVYV